MQGREASRTAEYMALFRALESARPADRRVLEDRFAKAFLRPRLRFVVDLASRCSSDVYTVVSRRARHSTELVGVRATGLT
jgi:O-methyltransferase involved in polyketide biosynthesis